MVDERKPYANLVERNVPSQLDPADLDAEIEIELPGSATTLKDEIEQEVRDGADPVFEVVEEDDGGVTVEFDPSDEDDELGFYDNLAVAMSDRELSMIAGDLLDEYEANKASRQEWEDTYADGLELLGFTYEERAQPFRGASGVTHPLLAEAATQFQAQAFNELLPAGGPVRTVVMGEETREKTNQAQRVKTFMNYYITNVMEDYTPDMDVRTSPTWCGCR